MQSVCSRPPSFRVLTPRFSISTHFVNNRTATFQSLSKSTGLLSKHQSFTQIRCISKSPLSRPASLISKPTIITRHGDHHHHHHHHRHVFDLESSHAQQAVNDTKDFTLGKRLTWIGFGTNIGFCITKFATGIISGSTAMIADAVHSLSDTAADIVTLLALRICKRPPSSQFPYGYGKFETLGALAVASILIAAGFGVAHHAWEHLWEPHAPNTFAAWVALASILVKEALFQATTIVGKRLHSQLLIANAWHHRSDAIASFVTLCGIVGAVIGFPALDPIAGLLVSGTIIKIGIDNLWMSIKELADGAVEPEVTQEVLHLLDDIEGVSFVKKLYIRKNGPDLFVETQLIVDDMLTMMEAATLCDSIKEEVMAAQPRVKQVTIEFTVATMNTTDQLVEQVLTQNLETVPPKQE